VVDTKGMYGTPVSKLRGFYWGFFILPWRR
jgi:hypothetical protein